MSVEGWEFPAELVRLQESPHVMRHRTEGALAALSGEVQRQHAVLQELLRLPSVVTALWYQERLDAYERDGFDWSGVQPGRLFKHLHGDSSWSWYTVAHAYGVEGAPPTRVRAWQRTNFTMSEREFTAEEFAARFGGWAGDEGA